MLMERQSDASRSPVLARLCMHINKLIAMRQNGAPHVTLACLSPYFTRDLPTSLPGRYNNDQRVTIDSGMPFVEIRT